MFLGAALIQYLFQLGKDGMDFRGGEYINEKKGNVFSSVSNFTWNV
jgi:hypothetical protein